MIALKRDRMPERVSEGSRPGTAPLKRPWNGASAKSKLCDLLIAFAVARLWRNVLSNALEPGWGPTKMGGPSARSVQARLETTGVHNALHKRAGAIIWNT